MSCNDRTESCPRKKRVPKRAINVAGAPKIVIVNIYKLDWVAAQFRTLFLVHNFRLLACRAGG
jgi:hypothetical protein